MTDLQEAIEDLAVLSDQLDEVVTGLDAPQWEESTPAPGWTVAHQIGHLSFIFRIAGMAASDPEGFAAMVAASGGDFDGAINAGLAEYLRLPRPELLSRWRRERGECLRALAAVSPDEVVPWLVRPLPPAVLASAGIMETFAHGQDIYDALEMPREPTDRIKFLVIFAVLTWDFGYQSRGLTPPDVSFRYELTAPSGTLWAYGPEDATQKILGRAWDFCLLVTRRRHRDDCAVTAIGADADQWLNIAQAYRGPAGPGRQPGQFEPAYL